MIISASEVYRNKLRDPRWQMRRLHVLAAAGWKCEVCQSGRRELQVNHMEYSPEPWDVPLSLLECLCATCHAWRTEYDRIFGRSRVRTLVVVRELNLRVLDGTHTSRLDAFGKMWNRIGNFSPTTAVGQRIRALLNWAPILGVPYYLLFRLWARRDTHAAALMGAPHDWMRIPTLLLECYGQEFKHRQPESLNAPPLLVK